MAYVPQKRIATSTFHTGSRAWSSREAERCPGDEARSRSPGLHVEVELRGSGRLREEEGARRETQLRQQTAEELLEKLGLLTPRRLLPPERGPPQLELSM